MADIKTPKERSKNMAAIKGKDTTPEVYLRKLLFSKGYRYRKNCPHITGHPDIWLPKYRAAVFVHGCYWHRHLNCKYAYTPKSNVEFWLNKFNDNVCRDAIVKQSLMKDGIRCIIVWECTIKAMQKSADYSENRLREIISFLSSNRTFLEL